MDQDSDVRVEGILSALEHAGHVSVNELSARFGVSAVTIRKDLQALERQSLLQRVRGGARSHAPNEEGSFTDRLGRGVAAKKAIARHAASLVSNGDVIALDSSTSAYFLALELLNRRDLVVITNSLRSAMLLTEESDATVVLLGGTVRRTASSTVGDPLDVLSGRGRITTAFLGLTSLSPERGLMELSIAEAESKRVLAGPARNVVGLFDSSKLDGFGLHPFATADRVTRLITDTGFDDAEAARWRALDVIVDRCDVKAAGRGIRAVEAADVG